MKIQIYYFLLTFALLAGCSKNDGTVPKDVILERVPEPQVVKEGGSEVISLTNLDAFQGKFSVGVYYTSDIQPSKYDVVIRKNNNDTTVQVFRKDITSFPTSLSLKAQDLETLFGTPVMQGDNYDISVDVYTASGKKFQAFPLVGSGYGSGIAQQPGAITSIRYSAPCPYHDDVYQGNFKILEDEWADYAAGDVVVVTRIDATHFSFKYAVPDALPIIVTVDPLTNESSVAKQIYSPSGYGAGMGAFSTESVPDPRNVVLPCAETFGVVLKHTSPAGTFASAAYIEMQKVN